MPALPSRCARWGFVTRELFLPFSFPKCLTKGEEPGLAACVLRVPRGIQWTRRSRAWCGVGSSKDSWLAVVMPAQVLHRAVAAQSRSCSLRSALSPRASAGLCSTLPSGPGDVTCLSGVQYLSFRGSTIPNSLPPCFRQWGQNEGCAGAREGTC